jgi:hypothetical protein
MLTYALAEKNTEPYNKGTYLGTKRSYIGLGYLTQAKQCGESILMITSILYDDMNVLGLDVFDKPISAKGDALTLYALVFGKKLY